MTRNKLTQDVDQILARLGSNSDRPAANHHRPSAVGFGLVGVLYLVPVVYSFVKVTVSVARFAAGQAVAEHVERVDEVAGPGRVADRLDDEGPPPSVPVPMEPSIDGVVVAVAEVRKQELLGSGVELFEDLSRAHN